MSYLDKTGLSHFFEKLKGVFAPKERGVEYIRGTWTAASGTWTGVTKDSELYDGKQIILYMPFAGSGNATLNLTLAGGGTTGAKNVYFESTTRFTTHKGQNSQLPLVYHKALKLSDNKTYEGWWYLANRDTNDNRTHTLRLYNTIKAKKAITKNTFIVGDADGYETLAVGVTFDIAYPVLFCGAALAVNGTNYADMYEQWYDLTLTNTLSSFVGVAGKMIYVVGTLSGTKFTVASPGATCEEPTSEDGKVYLLLGRCGNNYSDSAKNRVNLVPEHPLYAFQNGSFRPYVPPVNAEKVNGHTVNADVPSGAKFTDTNTWRGIQDNLTSDSATDSLSAKQGKALANGSARDSTKLPLAGGTMTGQLKTSFKGSVAFGSYGASATTIENLCEELRYSSGAIGSVNITTAYTKDIVTIPTGWYNFLWIPHRSGGQNGQAHNDNCNYGSLYLTNMAANESQFFFIHWTASSGVVALEDLLHTVLDYNNNTRIRFGYSTSGMTSASWLAAWDGYKLRAIAPGNLSINPSQIADGFTTNPFYINTHPESSPTIIPFINNDIAFLLKRGGSAVVKYDGVVKDVDISNVFDGSPSYWVINPTGVTEITIELTLHKAFTWTNNIYVDHGSNSWRSKYVKIEVMNTNYANDVWVQKLEETARTLGRSKVTMTHTPVGASNSGSGFNKIRFTFKDWATSTIFRIAQIGVINYGSAGLRETSMSRGIDDPVFRSITPNENNTYALGTSSKRWSDVYAQKGNFAGGITGDVTGHASKDLALTGGTMTGALNFANGTLNAVGDDAYLGDQNVAGMVALKGKTGTTGLRLIAKDATNNAGASITWDGTDLSLNGYTVKKSVPSDAKFTDTTYTAATAAPGKVASASAQGTSTNYARQDHTHGIDVATGDANGQVKIAGQNASVKGLAALAYKASLAEADIPTLSIDGKTSGTLPVSRGGTGKTTAKDAANDFMNALDTGSSTPADADYYISQYVNGGNTTKTYHRRPMSALWAYIQGKIQAWAKNLTAKGNLGWTDQTAGKIPVTNNTLAYWDGRYNASASNLTYCVKGAFGNLAVKDSLGKSDVGLGNVDNTSDANKPVSTAQRKAIDDKVPLIISSQTTTTNHWTGEAPFASLEDGQTIRYHLVRDPTGTADLTLTLSGGTDTPAYPIYFNTFSRVTTHFAVGQIITMTFRTDVQRNATGTKYTGWFVNDYRDSDTTTWQCWSANATKVGAGNKVFAYSLFMEKADGTYESIALSGGTGTGKTRNAAGFRPGRIWYYYSGTEKAAGAVFNYGTYFAHMDLRYSTNCAQTLTAQKPVYLVGEIIEGLFYIHDNNFIAQDLPTSENGLAYMYLGGAYSTYQIALMPDHPIYIYQGGRIKRWLEGIRTINGVGAGEDGNIDLEVDDITGNLISGSKVVRSVNEISPDNSGNVNIHTGWHAYLVWENANPSATFAAQTISLNLSHFDWVLIESRHFEEGNTTGYSTMLCRKGQTTSLLVMSHSNNRNGSRPALVTDTGVQFSVCTYNNGTNNNYGVPLRIYAISGTEATIAELVKEYIFKNGSFASPLVNSWGKVGNVATMAVKDGVITMKSTTTDTSTRSKPAYGYATTPIDLTNYKEFRARVKVKGKKGGAIGFSAAVPTSVANDVSSCGFAAYSQPTDSTATYEGWISVDISALSGNHYLGMWATGYHVSGSTSSPVGTVLIYEAYLIPNDE